MTVSLTARHSPRTWPGVDRRCAALPLRCPTHFNPHFSRRSTSVSLPLQWGAFREVESGEGGRRKSDSASTL